MKKIFKIIFYISCIFLFTLICLLIFIDGYKPIYKGEIVIDQIKSDVKVIYDNYGIPHIYAQNKQDGYFALGYLQAQERLFQMEIMKRLASGRLSEILGESLLDTDKFFRIIGIKNRAHKIAERLNSDENSEEINNLNNFLSGINNFIDNGKTPIEFLLLGIEKERFSIEDVHLLTGYMSFSFSIGAYQDPLINKLFHQLGEEYMKDFTLDTSPGTLTIPGSQSSDRELEAGIATLFYNMKENLLLPALTGSNSWVISPEKTKKGKVILSNDTHIGFSQPAIWYESHLEYPGGGIYGNYLAGFPYPLIGHTRDVAWGLTMFENDDFDFIRLETDETNENYKYRNEWFPFQLQVEIIEVKGKEPVTIEIPFTKFGPVINQVVPDVDSIENGPVACWWSYTHVKNNELKALHLLCSAKDISDAGAACALINAPGLNVMYGDKNGDIGWWGVAKLVKRDTGINSKMIIQGNDSLVHYETFYDFEDNPKSINSPAGYVYSANNQVDSIAGRMYPGYYAPDYRALRITQLLDNDNKWDLEKIGNLITDDVSAIHPEISKLLSALIQEEIKNKSEKIFEILTQWNGDHTIESVAPTIYYRWIYQILADAMMDEIGEKDLHALINTHLMKKSLPYILKNGTSPWWDNIETDKKETRNEIISNAFKKTIDKLMEQFGGDISEWKWGKVHVLEHQHPLGLVKPLNLLFNVGPHSVPGGIEVINNLSFNLQDQEAFKVTYGPAMRNIVDFSDIENAISVIPTGQSGFFMSRFYKDQVKLYNGGKFRKQMMNKEDIENNAYGTLILKPGR